MLLAFSPVRVVGFPQARYPTVIHPSASQRPMSDRARTLSEDWEKKGCEYWISLWVHMRHGGAASSASVVLSVLPWTSFFVLFFLLFDKVMSCERLDLTQIQLYFVFSCFNSREKNKHSCKAHTAYLQEIKGSSPGSQTDSCTALPGSDHGG